MNIFNIIKEEIQNVDETYQSVSEIKQLASDILMKTAEKNVENFNNKHVFDYLYGIHLSEIDTYKYTDLVDFIKNINIQIYYVPKENNGIYGNYSVYNIKSKKEFNPNASREINAFYDYQDLKNDIDSYIKQNNGIDDKILYIKIFYKFYNTLIHELQHAYDDYRSKTMAFNTKQNKSYRNKYDTAVNTNQNQNELQYDLEKNKAYLNLPHEIWARFTQAVTKTYFSTVDFKSDNTITNLMYPIDKVVDNFKRNFQGYHLLSDNMKKKLLNKVVQFWHYEQDKINKRNSDKNSNEINSDKPISEAAKNISDTEIIIDKGTELFHGTIEEFEKEKTTVGGYDNIFWTTLDSSIAQTYIPQSSNIYTNSSHYAMPSDDPMVVKTQLIMGINYDYSKAEFKNHRAISYFEAPIFQEYSDNYEKANNLAYQKYLEIENFIKEVKIKETNDTVTDEDYDKWGVLQDEYDYLLKQSRELNVSKFKNDFVNQKFMEMGYKPTGTEHAPDNNYSWKLKYDNGQVQPANYKAKGRLLIVIPQRDLKILDTTDRGNREGDLTDLDYHKHNWFQSAEQHGYDGIKINDFAQSSDQGNLGHTSIGLFKNTLKDVKIEEIDATHNDLEPHFQSSNWQSPEYKKYKGINEIIDEELEKIIHIYENPDIVKSEENNINIHYNDRNAYPFTTFKDFGNRVFIGKEGGTHTTIVYYYKDELPSDVMDRMRLHIEYDGRIFLNEKIISFWHYPDEDNFKEIIINLEKAFLNDRHMNVNIWNDPNYKIEVKNSDLSYNIIPIQQYIKSENPSELDYKQHIMSPLLKQKKSVPLGYGSKNPKNTPEYRNMRRIEFQSDESIKHLNKIISEMANILNEGIPVFHGSDRKFSTFDMSKIGSGDGKNLGGWGIYFSDSEDVSSRYVTSNGFLGEYELRNGNYFDLDSALEDGERIIRRLQQLGIDENQIEEFQNDYVEQAENYGNIDNKQAYDWLSYVLGGEKEASMFLKSMGYIGNTFTDKWNRDARNYVVFDTSSIIYT
jgi:hypothetical protein